MQVNELDILHHKILVGKSQNGDVTEYETELKNKLNIGIQRGCKATNDFIKKLNSNKKSKPTPFFIQKHAQIIIKIIEKPYKLIKWFMFLSVLIALFVEQGFFYYAA